MYQRYLRYLREEKILGNCGFLNLQEDDRRRHWTMSPEAIRIRIQIQTRIRNVYFVSGSDPDPAQSFGTFRFRIRNTAKYFDKNGNV
jgi:hypothetical protein